MSTLAVITPDDITAVSTVVLAIFTIVLAAIAGIQCWMLWVAHKDATRAKLLCYIEQLDHTTDIECLTLHNAGRGIAYFPRIKVVEGGTPRMHEILSHAFLGLDCLAPDQKQSVELGTNADLNELYGSSDPLPVVIEYQVSPDSKVHTNHTLLRGTIHGGLISPPGTNRAVRRLEQAIDKIALAIAKK